MAEAFKTTFLQKEAEKKKPFIKSPLAYLMAVVAGAIVAPTGLILSPVVLLLSNLKGEYTTKKGQKITPLASWIGTGVVLTPLCWVANQMMFSKPGPPKEATAQIKQFPVQPVLPSLRQQVKEVFPSREILIAYRTAWEQDWV